MVDKIWRATDVKMGVLSIYTTSDGKIAFTRKYTFIDGDGNKVLGVGGGDVGFEFELSALPPDIAQALINIDAYTKQKALEQEGMEAE